MSSFRTPTKFVALKLNLDLHAISSWTLTVSTHFSYFCAGLVPKSTCQVPTSGEDGLTIDESERELSAQLTGRLAGVTDVITHLRQLQQHHHATAVHGTLDDVITGSVTADVTAWLPGNNQCLSWFHGGSCRGCSWQQRTCSCCWCW